MKKKLSEDMKKLYRMRVYPIETDANTVEWVAEYPDLPGCIGAGDTAEEAVAMAIDAKKAWIEIALKDGENVPEPTNLYTSDYSGKFTLRLPKTLHRELTIQAEDEGVSLNQYILYLITKGLNKEEVKTRCEFKIETSFPSQDKFIKNWEYLSEESSVELLNNFSQGNRRF
ncbi:MAG TPA: toxin-antitoxin system HicB family antitoxin [Candidatus Atribacteria bacterium]|nr:toxin-antitoxin system HicB family antitoxin [Candidatus Atribacteria bacterium]